MNIDSTNFRKVKHGIEVDPDNMGKYRVTV
jgi:hypothetical protein